MWILLLGCLLLLTFNIVAIAASPDAVKLVETGDAAAVNAVFKSGDAWVVVCAGKDEFVNPGFVSAARALQSANISAGRMDCNGLLPSGVSVFDRFK
jgi:hypothetical protein